MDLIPSLKHNGEVASVTHTQRIGIAELIIATGPKLWWVILYFFWLQVGLVDIYVQNESAQIYIGAVKTWGVKEYTIGIYLSIQLMWAGTLSTQDWSNALNAIVSISGIITLIFFILFILNYQQFDSIDTILKSVIN